MKSDVKEIRISDSFYWGMVLEIKIWALGVFIATTIALPLSLSVN